MKIAPGVRIAALPALIVAGCAPAPERPLDSGDQYAFRLARTPYSAAMCISKNARARGGVAAEERIMGESGMEVVVRGSGTTLAVAKIVRAGTFSTADVLVGTSVSGDRAEFARSLISGC